MGVELQQLKEQVKKNIISLVDNGKFQEAQQLLNRYKSMVAEDIEVFSIEAIIAIHAGQLAEAQAVLEIGLGMDKYNFDLLYNLAYIFERQQQSAKALYVYQQLANVQYNEEQRILAGKAAERLLSEFPELDIVKEKIVFFVKTGMDSFLGDIISGLSKKYETKKVIVTDLRQIDTEMPWADICWFEWCDELIIHASQLQAAKEKKIICRLHSYEAFSEFPAGVEWNNVDKVIFVAEHIKDFVLENVVALSKEKTIVIPNGIEVSNYAFSDRKPGFNIAYVGYINYKKGPMLLLHAFKAIYDQDQRYKLFIAGVFQDYRDILYFKQTIQKMGLENSVFHDGWQENVDEWLNDKNYILCTSVLESQGMGIMQAMSKGIKPIIHNFVGAEGIYSEKYIWTTIDECVMAIQSKEYNSREYRQYIENKFSFALQFSKIGEVISRDLLIRDETTDKPLVTVGIINYNYAHYLEDSIGSVLSQTYAPIEILIADDCSTDGSIKKLKEYEKKYNNIRVIYHEKNSGSITMAIRDFIREAKGRYLTFLSADDFLSSNTAIEELVQELYVNSDTDYVYCDMNIVDKNKIQEGAWAYKQYTKDEIVFETFNRFGSGVVPITVGMYNVNFFRENNLTWNDTKDDNIATELNLASDTLNTLRYSKAGLKIRHLPKALVSYRHHDSNMTYNLKSRISSIISVIEYIVDNFSETIYFPHIEWDNYDENQRVQLKMFLLGVHYYNMIDYYYSGKWKPLGNSSNLFSKDELNLFLEPAVYRVLYYFNKSSKFSNYFKKDIDLIKQKLKTLGYKVNELSKAVPILLSQEDIVYEGHKLRKEILESYNNKYTSRNLRMLIFSPDNGAWRYTFQSWKSVLEHMGISVDIVYAIDANANYESYNVFITIANKYFIEQYLQNSTINKITDKVGIAAKDAFSPVNSRNDSELLNYMLQEQPFKFLLSSYNNSGIKYVFGEWLDKGIQIYSNLFGFNPLIHFPENVQKEFNYFFVGHNSHLKADETQKYVVPIFQKHKGLLTGTGWGEEYKEINPNDVRHYYNRAKINLNYHLHVQKQYECEVNERTYIICACGGFQLTDNPIFLKHLYNETEIAIAHDEKQYMNMFEYYSNKSGERLEMSYNALIKTYKNRSSLFHRMESLLKLLS